MSSAGPGTAEPSRYQSEYEIRPGQVEIFTIPITKVQQTNGFAVDIGSSMIKIAIATEGDTTVQLECVSFPISKVDEAVAYLKAKLGGKIKDGTTINVCGQPSDDFVTLLKKELSVKVNIVQRSKTECYCASYRFLTETLPLEELVHPETASAKAYTQSVIDCIMKAFDAMDTYDDNKVQKWNLESESEDQEIEDHKENKSAPVAATEIEYPVLLCVLGSRATHIKLEKDGTYQILDGSSRCGRMYLGLGNLLAGTSDFCDLTRLASNGDSEALNVVVKHKKKGVGNNMYGNMPDELTLYAFGHAMNKDKDDFSKEDKAAAALSAVCQDLVQHFHITAMAQDIKTMIVCGHFPGVSRTVREEISKYLGYRCLLNSKNTTYKYHYLKCGGYYAALGALLRTLRPLQPQLSKLKSSPSMNKESGRLETFNQSAPQEACEIAAGQEETMDVPADGLVQRYGVGLDIGGSLVKIVYATDEGATIRLHFVSYPAGRFEDALSFLKVKCSHLIPPDSTVNTCGIGFQDYTDVFEKQFKMQIKTVQETDCFADAYRFLVKRLALLELVHDQIGSSQTYMADSQGQRPFENETKRNESSNGAEKKNNDFPVLMCILGSAAPFLKILDDGTFQFADGTTRCGKMFVGLGKLLTGAKNHEELLNLVKNGDPDGLNVKGKLESIVGNDLYENAPQDGVLYAFGKANNSNIDSFTKEDIAATTLSVICEDMVDTFHLTAMAHDVQRILICGSFPGTSQLVRAQMDKYLRRRCSTNFMNIKFDYHFLKYGGYYGALGALLRTLVGADGASK